MMATLKDITIKAIKELPSYSLNNTKYINVKDLLTIKTYSKGCNNSVGTLIRRKDFDSKSVVFGAIDNNELVLHSKYSRKLSKYFVIESEVLKEFNEQSNPIYDIKVAPPIIDDNGFTFFKDAKGVEYNVEMRGTRTKDGIYFKAKDLQHLFEMPSLCRNITDKITTHTEHIDYEFFNINDTRLLGTLNNKDTSEQLNQNNKHLYITYKGLKKIINNAIVGRAKEFCDWIDDIIIKSLCGTKDQRIEVSSKILNIDAQALQSFMNKSASEISCLYLIDIKRSVLNKKVYKYGYTKNLKRRFKEHVAKYGDNISLETFCLIPMKNLSDAENELKNCISDYIQTHNEFDRDAELLFLCNEAQKNIKHIYNNISYRYCGDLDSIKLQYESIIRDKDNEITMIKKEMELSKKDSELALMKKNNELLQKDNQIMESTKDNQIKDMKIELLELKLKMMP